MVVTQLKGLEAIWRQRLEIAQEDHEILHNKETRDEVRRALRIFTDLVLRGKIPPVDADV